RRVDGGTTVQKLKQRGTARSGAGIGHVPRIGEAGDIFREAAGHRPVTIAGWIPHDAQPRADTLILGHELPAAVHAVILVPANAEVQRRVIVQAPMVVVEARVRPEMSALA